MTAEIISYLEMHRGDMIEFIERLVSLESPTSDKGACDKLIRFVAEHCSSFADQVETVPMDGFGDGLKVTCGTGQGQIMALSHLDTVWPVGETKERPFRLEGNLAFGPGVYDMKTGAAMAIWAARALKDLGRLPRKRIVLLFNCDEEVGTPASRSLIEAEAKKSGAALILEPSSGGKADIARKGVGMFTLTAQGRPAHAGADHQKGINANLELAHQIIRLEAMTDYGSGVTVNVGVIKGGKVRNQSAARAEALIDLRFKTPEQGEKAVQAILDLQPVLPGAVLKIDGNLNRPPLEKTPGNMALFKKAQDLAVEIGFKLEGCEAGGGSDGSFTSAVGTPTLDGLGAEGTGAHAKDEYVDFTHLVPRTALIARLLETA